MTAEGAGIRVVRVTGDLGSGSAASLDEVLGSQIDARLAGLVVDLSAASFIGVRGVAALVRAADRARRRALALSVVIGEHVQIPRVLSRVCRENGLLVHTSLDGSLHACHGLLPECDTAATSTAEPSRPGDDTTVGETLTIALHRRPGPCHADAQRPADQGRSRPDHPDAGGVAPRCRNCRGRPQGS